MSAQAASKLAINDTNFSSEVKKKAEEADTDGITNINLKGCINLQTVDCSEIFVTKLNLSGMKKLTSVSAFGKMETVNLKKCTSLKTVYLGGSQLKELYLSQGTAL